MSIVRKVIQTLVDTYKYKPLPPEKSKRVREYFQESIPSFVESKIKGELYSLSGNRICYEWDRIVIGDYGAYIEFTDKGNDFVVAEKQEWRMSEKYKNCKYLWLNPCLNDDTKIYLQQHTVSYADYVVGKFYVSVFDVKEKPI